MKSLYPRRGQIGYTLVLLVVGLLAARAQPVEQFQLLNVQAAPAEYRGRAAVHLPQHLNGAKAGYHTLALLTGVTFQDGTIEVDLAGALPPGVPELGRGFLGVAFRVSPDAKACELIHLRPNNARASDQLRRNHATQYVSVPDWSWERTRKETPGLYESYVDLEPAVWTHLRIVVSGVTASLYVNGAPQPCLIVNDLKLGHAQGAVGVWVGSGTDAYVADLRVTPQ